MENEEPLRIYLISEDTEEDPEKEERFAGLDPEYYDNLLND